MPSSRPTGSIPSWSALPPRSSPADRMRSDCRKNSSSIGRNCRPELRWRAASRFLPRLMRPTSRDAWPRPSSRRCGLAGHRIIGDDADAAKERAASRTRGCDRLQAALSRAPLAFAGPPAEGRSRKPAGLRNPRNPARRQQPARRYEAVGKSPDRPFRRVGRSAQRAPEALQEVKVEIDGKRRGLGVAGVAMLKAVRDAALRLSESQLRQSDVIGSWDKLIDYCKANIAHGTVEEFHLLFLNRKNELIKHERQQRGTIDHTPVYPREVVKRALELDASALILVHNRVNAKNVWPCSVLSLRAGGR